MNPARPARTRRSPRRTSAPRLLAAAVLGLLVLLAGPAAPAGAHADLSSSDPADGAVLDQAPTTITLQFTEPVTVQADGVRLLDADGAAMDTGPATVDGAVVLTPVEGSLPQGGYLVAWRAVSADGHPIRGALSFSVGVRTELRSGLADDAFTGNADRRDEVVGAALRGLTYLGVLGAAGAVLVLSFLHRPGDRPVVGRTVVLLALLGMVALLLQVPVQASLATGRGWTSITDDGVPGLVLGDGLGLAIAVTVAGLLALVLTSGLLHEGVARGLYTAGAVLAPLGLPLTGHTRTMSPAALGYASDAVHVLAAAVWFGGLVALVALVRRRRGSGDTTGAVDAVARYSGLAAAVVGAVVVAGLAMTWIEVGAPDRLFSTTYGRLLLAKVATVGAVLVGAAWNRFRLVPALTADTSATASPAAGDAAAASAVGDGAGARHDTEEVVDGRRVPVAVGAAGGTDVATIDVDQPDPPAGAEPPDGPTPSADDLHGTGATNGGVAPEGADRDDRTWAGLLRVVRLEVLGLLVVLALTGVLANVTPAKRAEGSGIVSVSAPMGTGTMEVVVDPAEPGRNDVHVYLLDGGGSADDRYQAAAFRLALPEQDVGPLEREPVRAGPGHFQLVGTDLDLAGEWTLTVTVKPDRFTEQAATVRFEVR